MSENQYDEKLCKQRCETVDKTLEQHEKRLNNHSDRLDRMEQRAASVDTKIENLCSQLQSLTTTLRWFIGLILGAFVSFFFYAAQKGLLK